MYTTPYRHCHCRNLVQLLPLRILGDICGTPSLKKTSHFWIYSENSAVGAFRARMFNSWSASRKNDHRALRAKMSSFTSFPFCRASNASSRASASHSASSSCLPVLTGFSCFAAPTPSCFTVLDASACSTTTLLPVPRFR